MSRSRDRRDAERAARRAERLAQRAEQRAQRKEEAARQASERAERLAERANRRPSRERDLEKSIEDLVDEVAENWTRKAEAWLDEQTGKLRDGMEGGYGADDYGMGFDDSGLDADFGTGDSSREAREAREDATRARAAAREARQRARASSSSRRSRRRGYSYGGHSHRKNGWRWKKGRDRGNLYRDKENAKVCGVCAGMGDYFDVPAWQIRLYAILGLIFLPSVIVPAYFITYFMLDDKPYYRRVTDRFEEYEDDEMTDEPVREEPRKRTRENKVDVARSNRESMRVAREKFGDIENRLRAMESHVTSSSFELQRELRKISGEDT